MTKEEWKNKEDRRIRVGCECKWAHPGEEPTSPAAFANPQIMIIFVLKPCIVLTSVGPLFEPVRFKADWRVGSDEHLQLWDDWKLKTSYWFFNQTKLHWIETGAVAAGWHWGVKSDAKKVLMKWLITLHYCIFYFWLCLSLSCLSLSLITDQTENALSSSSHSGTLVLLRAAARLDKLHIPSFCLLFTVSLDTWLRCARIFSETFSSSFFLLVSELLQSYDGTVL